jgi:hypothetical protein
LFDSSASEDRGTSFSVVLNHRTRAQIQVTNVRKEWLRTAKATHCQDNGVMTDRVKRFTHIQEDQVKRLSLTLGSIDDGLQR